MQEDSRTAAAAPLTAVADTAHTPQPSATVTAVTTSTPASVSSAAAAAAATTSLSVKPRQSVTKAAVSEFCRRTVTDIVGCAPPAEDANLFEVGANSVHIVRLCAAVNAEYALRLPVIELFRAARVAAIADLVVAAVDAAIASEPTVAAAHSAAPSAAHTTTSPQPAVAATIPQQPLTASTAAVAPLMQQAQQAAPSTSPRITGSPLSDIRVGCRCSDTRAVLAQCMPRFGKCSWLQGRPFVTG